MITNKLTSIQKGARCIYAANNVGDLVFKEISSFRNANKSELASKIQRVFNLLESQEVLLDYARKKICSHQWECRYSSSNCKNGFDVIFCRICGVEHTIVCPDAISYLNTIDAK